MDISIDTLDTEAFFISHTDYSLGGRPGRILQCQEIEGWDSTFDLAANRHHFTGNSDVLKDLDNENLFFKRTSSSSQMWSSYTHNSTRPASQKCGNAVANSNNPNGTGPIDEYSAATSLLEFGTQLKKRPRELVPFEPQGRTFENTRCFSMEVPGEKSGESKSRNAFIIGRKSLYPLLRCLRFEYISPLISMLWGDDISCQFYDYSNFLMFYTQSLRSHAPSHPTVRRTRPIREDDKEALRGIGAYVLKALILMGFDKPFDSSLKDKLSRAREIYTTQADAQKASLIDYIFLYDRVSSPDPNATSMWANNCS